MTSAGQLVPAQPPPHFILIERALRDEGTSYHYVAPSELSTASATLLAEMGGAFDGLSIPLMRGATWTTDAPFRETSGRQGIARLVRNHCALARRLERQLAREPNVHVLNTVHLNQLIVGFGEGTLEERNALTRATIARLQAENSVLAGGAEWRGQWVLRLSLISAPLSEADVDRLGMAVLSAWRDVQREGR
jgi:hypothetical protein